MNKEKFEKYLKKTHIPLTKEFLTTIIIIAFITNAILYYFFKNNIETIISTILFIIFSITLIRNRNYLKEYDSSLLVKATIAGYIFWLILMFNILIQLKFNINLWFYILEIFLLAISIIITKRSYNKMFEENEYRINYDSYEKAPKKVIAIVIFANLFFVLFKAFFNNITIGYIISALIFIITFCFSQLFISTLLIYLGYLKCFKNR